MRGVHLECPKLRYSCETQAEDSHCCGCYPAWILAWSQVSANHFKIDDDDDDDDNDIDDNEDDDYDDDDDDGK